MIFIKFKYQHPLVKVFRRYLFLKEFVKSKNAFYYQIMTKVMQVFRPSAVVLQCGADSLDGDRLGPFNLTLKYFYILSLQTNRIIIKFSHATRLHAMAHGGEFYDGEDEGGTAGTGRTTSDGHHAMREALRR